MLLVQPEKLPQQPFEPVSAYGIAGLAAHGQTDPPCRAAVFPIADKQNEVP